VEHTERTVERIVQETGYDNLEFLIVARNSFGLSSMKIPPSSTFSVRSKLLRYSCQAGLLAAINDAVNDCRGEFVALLDCGTKMTSSGWLTDLLAVAAQPGVGAVSAKILNKDGTVEHAGYVLGLGGPAGSAFSRQPGNSPCYFGRAKLISSFSATTGSCMVIKKSRFQQVGGYEEHELSRSIADVDLCLRLGEAGYRTVLNPNALLIRLESSTYEELELNPDQQKRDKQFMHELWGEELLNDPFYSPNLTLDFEDFSYAWPPRVQTL
jgi:cellulose synthase/poly-beta-1,6-N-acetylglucosamine synthase-like glycosyltransferase